jgi:hypothetical protein
MQGNRGVVLVTVMLLVLVLGMLARAAFVLGPAALALSESTREDEAAQHAADAGLAYARSKLLERPGWKGDDNRVTVSLPDFTVVEDNGNVIGLLSTPDGSLSQFRIRFNFQDGAAGGDGLNDPGALGRVDNIYVSVNNLENDSQVILPRADKGTFSVVAPTVGSVVPKQSACVVVEGRAGRGLLSLTPASPNGPVSGGKVVTRVVEACLQKVASLPVTDAPIMGGGNVNFNLADTGVSYLEVNAERSTPRLRSKMGVNILAGAKPGTLRIRKGEVGRDPSIGFQGNVPPGQVAMVDEKVGDGRDFYNLKWSDVALASDDPVSNSTIQIPGGTYVYWPDGSLHYYDKTLADYQAYMSDPANAADAGIRLSRDLREVRAAGNLSRNPYGIEADSYGLEIDRNLRVLPSAGGSKQLNIIPKAGFRLNPADTANVIGGAAAQPNQATYQISLSKNLTCSDDVVLVGQLNTKGGTVVSEGNLTMSTSVNEYSWQDRKGRTHTRRVTNQLSIYVKKDVVVSSYQEAKGAVYDDVLLQGVVYSWGNFSVQAGDSATPSWGEFNLNGCMVAYGADPSTGQPGTAGGTIDVTSRTATLSFDPRSVSQLCKQNTLPVRMARTTYAIH